MNYTYELVVTSKNTGKKVKSGVLFDYYDDSLFEPLTQNIHSDFKTFMESRPLQKLEKPNFAQTQEDSFMVLGENGGQNSRLGSKNVTDSYFSMVPQYPNEVSGQSLMTVSEMTTYLERLQKDAGGQAIKGLDRLAFLRLCIEDKIPAHYYATIWIILSGANLRISEDLQGLFNASTSLRKIVEELTLPTKIIEIQNILKANHKYNLDPFSNHSEVSLQIFCMLAKLNSSNNIDEAKKWIKSHLNLVYFIVPLMLTYLDSISEMNSALKADPKDKVVLLFNEKFVNIFPKSLDKHVYTIHLFYIVKQSLEYLGLETCFDINQNGERFNYNYKNCANEVATQAYLLPTANLRKGKTGFLNNALLHKLDSQALGLAYSPNPAIMLTMFFIGSASWFDFQLFNFIAYCNDKNVDAKSVLEKPEKELFEQIQSVPLKDINLDLLKKSLYS